MESCSRGFSIWHEIPIPKGNPERSLQVGGNRRSIAIRRGDRDPSPHLANTGMDRSRDLAASHQLEQPALYGEDEHGLVHCPFGHPTRTIRVCPGPVEGEVWVARIQRRSACLLRNAAQIRLGFLGTPQHSLTIR